MHQATSPLTDVAPRLPRGPLSGPALWPISLGCPRVRGEGVGPAFSENSGTSAGPWPGALSTCERVARVLLEPALIVSSPLSASFLL